MVQTDDYRRITSYIWRTNSIVSMQSVHVGAQHLDTMRTDKGEYYAPSFHMIKLVLLST